MKRTAKRNIAGFVDKKGRFHPIRKSPDYDPEKEGQIDFDFGESSAKAKHERAKHHAKVERAHRADRKRGRADWRSVGEDDLPSLAQFVRKHHGIQAKGMFKGEIERLSAKESGSSGLVARDFRRGLNAEYMRDYAAEAGLIHPEMSIGDFLSAVERSAVKRNPKQNAARLTEADLARLGPRYRAQIEAQLGKVEQQEAKAKTPKQRKAVEVKKRSIFSRMADMLSSRKRAAKKAAALEAKAKLLRVKAARPTLRARAKKRVAKGAHGLVSRILGNPSLDEKINRLKPGQSLKLGKTAHGETWVERSGDGKTLRFVRATKSGTEVFRTRSWEERNPKRRNATQSQRGAGSTRSEVRSPTKTEVRSPTSTSTHAKTTGNFTATVTGGAGAGATNVKIYTRGKKGNPKRRRFYVSAYHVPSRTMRAFAGFVALSKQQAIAKVKEQLRTKGKLADYKDFSADVRKSNPKRRNSNVMRARGAVVASSNPRKNSPKRSVRKKKIYTHMGTKKTGYKMKLIKTRKKRRNGESAADRKVKSLRQKFTGRSVNKMQAVLVPDNAPARVVKIGRLVKLDTDKAVFNFPEKNAPILVSDASGRRFFIAKTKGNPGRFGTPGDYGKVRLIEYAENKPGLSRNPRTIWFHKHGENSGARMRFVINGKGEGCFKGAHNMRVTAAGLED